MAKQVLLAPVNENEEQTYIPGTEPKEEESLQDRITRERKELQRLMERRLIAEEHLKHIKELEKNKKDDVLMTMRTMNLPLIKIMLGEEIVDDHIGK